MSRPLPLSQITVTGELRTRLVKHFARMHDKLYRSGYAGDPYCSRGWPGDWEGRAMLALILDSETLKSEATTLPDLIDWIYALMNDEGYRSEPNDKLNLEDINEQMHSAQNWLLRAFMEQYRITGDVKYYDSAKNIIQKLYLPIIDHLANYPRTAEDRTQAYDNAVVGHSLGHFKEWRLSSDVGCIFMSFDAMGQAWEMITEEPLHSQIGIYIDALLDAFRSVDYVGSRLQTHATLTCMRGLMRVYRVKRDPSLLATIVKYFDDFEAYGMTANYENSNSFMVEGHTEPCGMVDSYMLACQLWEETGNRHYLDISHKIWWNAFMRSQRDNGGMGCDYTATNGWLKVFDVFYEAAHCCTMRGAEGLGYPVRHALYESANAITLPFYFDFDAQLADGNQLSIRTRYPEVGEVRIKVKKGNGNTSSLKLYLPEWVDDAVITCNGRELDYTMTDECFATVDHLFQTDDEIVLTFSQYLRKVPCERYWHAGKGRYTLEFGNLVLGTNTEVTEELDLACFDTIGNAKFQYKGQLFEPLHMCYFMTKDEVMTKSLQIVFGGS